MYRNYRLTLEERLSRLEKIVNERRKPTNEISPIVAKVASTVIRGLPMILKALPEFIKLLEGDQVNDNTDKIELLNQFVEIGEKVSEMFGNMNKQ